MLPGAGERVEQGRFARIRVARQGYGERSAQRRSLIFVIPYIVRHHKLSFQKKA
jgi:hypothetical protein